MRGEKKKKVFTSRVINSFALQDDEGVPCCGAGCPIPNSVRNPPYLVQTTNVSEGASCT